MCRLGARSFNTDWNKKNFSWKFLGIRKKKKGAQNICHYIPKKQKLRDKTSSNDNNVQKFSTDFYYSGA
jgi:hypothetical protein